MAVTATRDEINLNGTWSFTPHDGGLNPGVKTTIRVPDAWDAAPGFYDATSATYEKTVAIPSAWSGRDVFLEIYEANWHVDLTINSTVFPRVSEGIGVPTIINITSALVFGQNNTLKIRITRAGIAYGRDRPSGTFRWEQNLGLTGDVFLRSYSKVRIADAFVKTSTRSSNIAVQYEVANYVSGARTLTLEPRVLELNNALVMALPTQSVVVGSGLVSTTIQQAWANPVLWTPANPHLYYLETTLKEGSTVVDIQRVRFGFREVWTQGTDLLLNGIPVTLFTDSNDLFQHAFMNYYYQMWYDEAATRATVEKFRLSRNAIRIHQAPAVRQHVLDVFDEEGVLVIAESAVYGGSYSRGYSSQAGPSLSPAWLAEAVEPLALSAYIDNAVQWIPKWVRRERNHPSVIIWSAENEMGPGWLTQDQSQLWRLGDEIRRYDPTRPVIFEGDHACCGSNFNSLHYNQDGPTNDWPTDNDIYGYAQRWWDATRPNSHNEYAFIGWQGNGIFQATSGSSPANLTSMQGTRLRGGLLTRGYRYQGWATMAPHTFVWQWADFYGPQHRAEDEFVARSFMPVAAFDVDYDRLGENPLLPVIPANAASLTRSVVVYNQEVSGTDSVTLVVEARSDEVSAPFYTYTSGALNIARGRKQTVSVAIQNLPAGSHWIELDYKVYKDDLLRFSGEKRDFWRDGADVQAPPVPTGLQAAASGGPMGVLDRNMVYLTWDVPNSRGDLAGWVIYRGTSPNPTAVEDEVKLWGEKEKFDSLNEYFDIVPGPGTYYYRISAKDLKGNLSTRTNQVVVVVTDSETPLRDPGFEMESRLYKNAGNQYYTTRTWGERWTLPAILGGSMVAPHSGRYAGLINGDGAHATNAFVDKFTFFQRTARVNQPFHVGAYFKIAKVWRGRDDPNAWLRPGLRLAVVGGDGSSYFYNPFQSALVDIPTLRQWEGDGQWHYVSFTMSAPPADNDGFFEIVVRDGEGDADWREPLLDAYVDDLVLAPLGKIPPVALATASKTTPYTGEAVTFNAAQSFAFNTSGVALAPNTNLTYAWDFGNGQTASGSNPQMMYLFPGDYIAHVTVTDQKGLIATAQVYVSVSGPPRSVMAASLAAADQGQTITFTIHVGGSGQPMTITDTLPVELQYVPAATTDCPMNSLTYNAGPNQIIYAGTPTGGQACAIQIMTTVNTSQRMRLSNIASVNDGLTAVYSTSVAVLLNPLKSFLPLISR